MMYNNTVDVTDKEYLASEGAVCVQHGEIIQAPDNINKQAAHRVAAADFCVCVSLGVWQCVLCLDQSSSFIWPCCSHNR